MTIIYSSDFISDLDAIESLYRDEYFLPKAGRRLISDILDVCDSIEKFPLIGISLESKDERGKRYRYVVHGNYLLFYAIEDDTPIMLRVLDGRMDYLRILFKDELNQMMQLD